MCGMVKQQGNIVKFLFEFWNHGIINAQKHRLLLQWSGNELQCHGRSNIHKAWIVHFCIGAGIIKCIQWFFRNAGFRISSVEQESISIRVLLDSFLCFVSLRERFFSMISRTYPSLPFPIDKETGSTGHPEVQELISDSSFSSSIIFIKDPLESYW